MAQDRRLAESCAGGGLAISISSFGSELCRWQEIHPAGRRASGTAQMKLNRHLCQQLIVRLPGCPLRRFYAFRWQVTTITQKREGRTGRGRSQELVEERV